MPKPLMNKSAVALMCLSLGLAAACGSTSETTSPTPSVDATAPDESGAPAAVTTTSGLPATAATTTEPTTSVPTAPETSATTSATSTPTTIASTTSTAPPSTIGEPAPTTIVSSELCVSTLTIREQAALLVWPSVYSTSWGEAERVVAESGIGGVLLMRPDGWTSNNLTGRLASLEAASRHGLIVATDEEGGDVQRLRIVGDLPSQRDVSTSMTVEDARRLIAGHGLAVRSTGVDMVLGPVVDVEPNAGEVPLQPSRFFVGEPASVSAYAGAYIDGWSESGLLSVLKHFPGHGAASGDTHITAGITPSFADIEGWDLRPYADLAGRVSSQQVAVMVGHLTVPGLTDGVPATRSAAAVNYLRNDLGYGDALLITDALGMAAVGLAEPEASVLAVAAGIDIVIFTQTSQTGAVIDALVAAVDAGQIPAAQLQTSAGKVMGLLERDGHTCNQPQL